VKIRAVAAALTFFTLVVGCGSSGSAAELEQSVRSYSAAFLSGQGEKAAGMLSARCNSPQIRGQIVQAAAAAPALYGTAKLVSVVPTVDADRDVPVRPAGDRPGEPAVGV
jgi:hypothetical protein